MISSTWAGALAGAAFFFAFVAFVILGWFALGVCGLALGVIAWGLDGRRQIQWIAVGGLMILSVVFVLLW